MHPPHRALAAALAVLAQSACCLDNPIFLSGPDGGLEDARRRVARERDAAEAAVDGIVDEDVAADISLVGEDAAVAVDRAESSDVDASASGLDGDVFDAADALYALDVIAPVDRIEGEDRADVTGDDRRPINEPADVLVDAARYDDRLAIDVVLSCSPGTMACGGECVDVTADRRHCGVCDRSCQRDELCLGGGCTWPRCGDAGERFLCGATCVDLATDPNHCGACRSPCGAEQSCRLGLCNGH